MTRLDALNICLASIGVAPTNSITNLHPDGQMALDTVHEVTRQLCIHGWHWNMERHTIEPDAQKYLMLPANTARIRSESWLSEKNLVQRGLRLFDTLNNTYEFDNDVDCELYVFLPFEDIIPPAQECIAYKSALVFQERVLGSAAVDTMLASRYADSMNNLQRVEVRNSRPNMLRDNLSTANILNRDYFARGMFR